MTTQEWVRLKAIMQGMSFEELRLLLRFAEFLAKERE